MCYVPELNTSVMFSVWNKISDLGWFLTLLEGASNWSLKTGFKGFASHHLSFGLYKTMVEAAQLLKLLFATFDLDVSVV